MSITKVVKALREGEEDFEWYPTTPSIIKTVVRKVDELMESDRWGWRDEVRFLDVGAGDGRVLKAFEEGLKLDNWRHHLKLYAIEKAVYHQSNMPKDIVILGTDFHQQTLADKPVHVLFCNPPYSEYENWVLRIIKEASARHIFLVIPQRWQASAGVQGALDARGCEVETLGKFDFEDGDRKARAKVEIVHIEVGRNFTDAFDSVIEGMLPEMDLFNMKLEEEKVDLGPNRGLSEHENLVERLVKSYDEDLAKMVENYRCAIRIDQQVLREIGVSKESVLTGIKLKIGSLKKRYWEALFEAMDTITQRLATKQRKAFLQSLTDKVAIDFTENNAYAILIWVAKWANDFFDEQLIELFRTLSCDSNVVKYKSNQRVWEKSGWRYGDRSYRFDGEEGSATHYKLEYRMVITHGGIATSGYSWRRDTWHGLDERAFDLLRDIVTVANNLGFNSKAHPNAFQWESNKQNVLRYTDGSPLVAVRAFKNGNMHLHFDPKLMLAINVEAGRLLKWIRNPAEAATEMELNKEEAKQAAKMFGSMFHIAPDGAQLKLVHSQPGTAAPIEPEPAPPADEQEPPAPPATKTIGGDVNSTGFSMSRLEAALKGQRLSFAKG